MFLTKHLNQINIRQRLDGLWGVGQCVEVADLWLGVLSLQVLSWGSGTDGVLDGLVLDLAGNDLRLASGRLQVGNSDVELLAKDAAVDLLVDSDTDGTLGHVENNSGTSVVVLERHTLVDGRIHFNVDIVSSLDGTEEEKLRLTKMETS